VDVMRNGAGWFKFLAVVSCVRTWQSERAKKVPHTNNKSTSSSIGNINMERWHKNLWNNVCKSQKEKASLKAKLTLKSRKSSYFWD